MAIPSVGSQAFLQPMPPQMGSPMGASPFGNPQALPFGLQQIPQQFQQITQFPQQIAQAIPQMIPNLPNWSAPFPGLPNASQLGAAAMTMLPPGLQTGLQNFPPPGFNPFMPPGGQSMGALPMGAPGGFSAMG